MKVRNPRTGEEDYHIEPLSAVEVAAVADGLRSRQLEWMALGAGARGEHLRALAEGLRTGRASLLDALAADTGRRAISALEVEGTIRSLERWADRGPVIIETAQDSRPSSTPGIEISTRLVPYALVGAISPWNFPLTLAMIDAIPALAAGAAVIVKPSEVTPRFIRPLMQIVEDFPNVPLAIIEGDGATGAALIEVADYVAFTGSVATGRKVAEAAARAFIPASLELGGKDPMIILSSADPAQAARTALRASVVNAGQACQSIERVYVHRSIASEFLKALVADAEKARLTIDDPGSGEIGPFIFAGQAEIVAAQLADAAEQGAKILTGGEIEERGGCWLRPTVVTDVTPAMRLMREETFGPVIPVTVFDAVEDAVALANGTEFGLSAAVLAGSVAEAEAVAVKLEAGAISINDGALTSMVWDAEKSSFGTSGLGPSRMGESGLLRFFRKQALLRQTAAPMPLAAFAEETLQ